MHYSMFAVVTEEEVVSGGSENLEEILRERMSPFCEHNEYDSDEEYEEHRDSLFWDWFQIGGRWTGLLSGYDPEKNPDNYSVCSLCGGIGQRHFPGWEREENRKWMECNGCDGTGYAFAWPTQWKFHNGDVMKVEDVLKIFDPEKHTPYSFLSLDGIPYHSMIWDSAIKNLEYSREGGYVKTPNWSELVKTLLEQAKDHYVVVVDYHS